VWGESGVARQADRRGATFAYIGVSSPRPHSYLHRPFLGPWQRASVFDVRSSPETARKHAAACRAAPLASSRTAGAALPTQELCLKSGSAVGASVKARLPPFASCQHASLRNALLAPGPGRSCANISHVIVRAAGCGG
jgi:hypothetical protein